MIEKVVASALPVDEMMRIEKNRLEPEHPVERPKRMVIVTGTHGDELEGQFCCYEIIRRIKEHKEYLNGIVDVFPALNPLGIDTITRGIPKFDLDMNRIFPGNLDGSLAEYTAWQVIENIKGADVCVDIHSSNIFLREIPQIRINEETADRLVPLALKMNVDYIWVHSASTVLEATLAHSLNKAGVPTLVVGYSVKARGIARDLFGTEEGYVLPVQQLRESDELTRAFVRLYEKRDAIRTHLNETIPGYIARADEARKALEELLLF